MQKAYPFCRYTVHLPLHGLQHAFHIPKTACLCGSARVTRITRDSLTNIIYIYKCLSLRKSALRTVTDKDKAPCKTCKACIFPFLCGKSCILIRVSRLENRVKCVINESGYPYQCRFRHSLSLSCRARKHWGYIGFPVLSPCCAKRLKTTLL
ncbi:hypothetical protein SAMN02910436_01086 [Ruminococcaceae bacterium P7]|nr:hypothetical protein SAMN02910436_01086 [Ruminococcaceae bacterium P7]